MTFFTNKREANAVMSIRKILMLILIIPAVTPFFFKNSHAEVVGGCQIVTYPNNITFSDDWYSAPTICTSSETVSPGGTVNAWVIFSGWHCPPYSWSVLGTGYEIAPAVTHSNGEVVTIKCLTGT